MTKPQNKILILIIAALLIVNIGLVSFLIIHKTPTRNHDDERRSYVAGYLEKEVGFNKQQLLKYDSLSKLRRDRMQQSLEALAIERKNILKQMADSSFSDEAVKQAAMEINEQQKPFEIYMLRHLKSIREICNETQRPRFDTGFYKIFGKRFDSNKRK